MTDASNAFYIRDGVIYEVRVKIYEDDSCLIVKTSDPSTITVGSAVRKRDWCIMIDEANYRAIQQMQDKVDDLRVTVGDMEHKAARNPVGVDIGFLTEKQFELRLLEKNLEEAKYSGPTRIRIITYTPRF